MQFTFLPSNTLAMSTGPAVKVTPDAHRECHHGDSRAARVACREAINAASGDPVAKRLWWAVQSADEAFSWAIAAGASLDERKAAKAALDQAQRAYSAHLAARAAERRRRYEAMRAEREAQAKVDAFWRGRR